jgi:hypothetical protein
MNVSSFSVNISMCTLQIVQIVKSVDKNMLSFLIVSLDNAVSYDLMVSKSVVFLCLLHGTDTHNCNQSEW